MHDLSLLDETLDINITKSYHISIQASLNGFSYCLLDTVRNKYVALKHYAFNKEKNNLEDNLKKVLAEDEFLKLEYKSSKLIYISKKSTLIPVPLFSKDNLNDYLTFNHTVEEKEDIHFNKLKGADAYVVFAIPGFFSSVFNKSLPSLKIYHQSSPFIENIFWAGRDKKDQDRVYLNISGGIFDIAVISGKKLSLYNCFSMQNENDLNYFVLYIFEQLKLDPEKTELVLAGEISKTMKHYEILKKYIRHLSFEKTNNQFTYSYTFNEIPAHTFVNLLNLYTCE
ncbi:MAG: DUF3822 family protein [Bacteroidales bacterium]|nr:MAG: DUF3822 family protein [Bacteroidales bacterium]